MQSIEVIHFVPYANGFKITRAFKDQLLAPLMSQALLKRVLGQERFWVCLEARKLLWLSKSINFEKELALLFY